jgi:hypothetical protein
MGNEMKMTDYEMDLDLDLMEAEYGDEIMCVGWNPDIDLACQQLQLVPDIEQITMLADPTMMLSELCLRQMYSCRF